jgi:D-alanyl-D-alanine carboxypeptidase
LTSVHRDGRSLIAVVMGGRSAPARDRIMENLIADHIAEASAVRTATQIADASPAETTDARAEPHVEPPVRPRPASAAQAEGQRVSTTGAVEEGDNAAGDDEGPATQPMSRAPAPAPRATQPTAAADGATASTKIQARLAAASALMPPARLDSPDVERHVAPAQAPEQSQDSDATSARGWMVQVGAPDSLAKANALLTRARERNRSTLASAKPLTEKVRKGDATLYRARFAGLDSASAEAACRSLKRTGFSCFAAHD